MQYVPGTKWREPAARCIQCSIDWWMQYSHWVTESVVGRSVEEATVQGLINWSADPISSYYQEEIATSSAGKDERLMPVALLSFTRFVAREEMRVTTKSRQRSVLASRVGEIALMYAHRK